MVVKRLTKSNNQGMATRSPYRIDTAFCPNYHHAVELLGARWSGAIIRGLLMGLTRFSELRGAIPGLSDRMLSERLKDLEAEGVVERRVIPETPVRIEYHLTPKGLALADAVEAISRWATEWTATQ